MELKDILIGLLILVSAGFIIYGAYTVLSRLLSHLIRFVFKRELLAGKLRKQSIRRVAKLIVAGLMVCLVWLNFPNIGCNAAHDNVGQGLNLSGLQGKIAYHIPDTFYVGKKNERVRIRIAKASLDDKVFLKELNNINDTAAEKATIDTIPLSSIMEVNLIETTPEKKLDIRRVNNNKGQAIDTSGYTEWLFDVTAHHYGEVDLAVSVSVIVSAGASSAPRDIRVYDKTVKAYATPFKTVTIFFSDHYLIAGSASLMLFLALYRVLPEWTGKVRIIKIFLASSEELKEDRQAVEIFMSRENKKWRDKGLFFDLIIWEDFFNAISKTSLQDEYNKAIKTCDMCVVLFFTKVGKYTQIEFQTAYQHFKEKGKPLIFTFFKQRAHGEPVETSIADFQNELSKIGHFYTKYTNTEDLLLQLDDQVEKIYDKKKK